MKSYMAKTGERERKWVAIDASGLVLGRLAAEVARRLQGKHRPEYTPHVDTGEFIVVTHANKIVITGNKLDQRKIESYSGYHGGLRLEPLRSLFERDPERVVRLAVARMLPKSRLGRKMLKKLKVYSDATIQRKKIEGEHPHQAQQPEALDLACARRKG